jgi:hypothetical protein
VQQPFGQEFALQAHVPCVVSHVPAAHATQAAPPVPHCEADCDESGTQVLPLQQPLGHDVASHTHWPVFLSQSCPDAHARQAAPPVPQEPLDSDAYDSQVPLAVQQP